jgi:hypothetical protein
MQWEERKPYHYQDAHLPRWLHRKNLLVVVFVFFFLVAEFQHSGDL